MNPSRLFAAMLLAAAPVSALAADYVIDKAGQHAFVTFKASHLGYSYILGHFEDFDGTFSYDPENPGASRVEVEIRTASLDTDHDERDAHLTGDEYLDADKYPTVTFRSTGYKGDAKSGVLTGELDFRGVTRSIDMNVRHIGSGADPWGGYRSGFEGAVVLSAADYGLPAWVGDVEVALIVEGIRQ